jgi:SDR family mycofactocin-dependent oxidoreductase
MGRFENKVVFITGVARGQGRSHALRFAAEGAHIVGLDLAAPVSSVPYAPATAEDLKETTALLDAAGANSIIVQGDVRNQKAIDDLVDAALETFGGIDIVLPQAGITTLGSFWELSDQQWNEMIDINLTGVFRTLRATIPTIIDRGSGGSIVVTSSVAGLAGMPHAGHYAATKHGVDGIVKTLANELAPFGIRVNTVNPTNVGTKMILDDAVYKVFRPDVESPTLEDAVPAFK